MQNKQINKYIKQNKNLYATQWILYEVKKKKEYTFLKVSLLGVIVFDFGNIAGDFTFVN